MAFPTTSRDSYTVNSPYEADNGSLWYWDDPRWVPVPPPAVTPSSVITALEAMDEAEVVEFRAVLDDANVVLDPL